MMIVLPVSPSDTQLLVEFSLLLTVFAGNPTLSRIQPQTHKGDNSNLGKDFLTNIQNIPIQLKY